MKTATTQHFASLSGCLFAAHGVYMVGAALALGVLCWWIPGLLAKIAESEVRGVAVPQLVHLLITHRPWVPLVALPTLFFGVLLTMNVRFRWVWLMFGLVSMLLPAALLIYAFLVLVGPLYYPAPDA